MREWIKGLWRGRPRLSRGQRGARNLILTGALLLAVWGSLQPICWTGNQALRRMERQLLLSPGRTLYQEPDGDGTWGDLAFVLGDTYAYTARVRNRDLGRSFVGKRAALTHQASLDGPPALLPLIGQSLGTGERWEGMVFCPKGPEEGAWSQLTLTCQYRLSHSDGSGEADSMGRVELYGQAEADRNGVFAFCVKAGDERQAMVLCQLMGGWGRERGEGDRVKRYCTLTQVNYRMDFYSAQNIPVGQAKGELDLAYQVGGV